jgi:hypothetical protein
MRHPRFTRAAVFGALLLPIAVACGGAGTAATLAPRPSSAGPAAATGATAAAPAATTPAIIAPTTAANPANAIEACTLLTPAEVAAASGQTLDTATKDSDPIYSYCMYTGSGGKMRTFVTQDAAAIPTVYGTMKINKGEAVSGVGEDAFWSEDGFQPGIYFMKNGALAYISGAQTGPEPKIVELAKLMASRM